MLWVPYGYPREAPLVYVTPTEGMMVRPGQHVDPQGKIYHPYLVGWAEFWDVSGTHKRWHGADMEKMLILLVYVEVQSPGFPSHFARHIRQRTSCYFSTTAESASSSTEPATASQTTPPFSNRSTHFWASKLSPASSASACPPEAYA
jgi:hypothetical protein